jgi:uncharacterized protein YjbI with pentapeptide repeats
MKDFSNQDLRGQSFEGLNLSRADFTYADIRGSNFTNAVLEDANFSFVVAGLHERWVIFLSLASVIFSALSGIFSGVSSILAVVLLKKELSNPITGVIVIVSLLVFFYVTLRKGLIAGLVSGVAFLAPLLILSAVFTRDNTGLGVPFFIGVGAIFLIAISLASVALSTAELIVVLGSVPLAMFGTSTTAIFIAAVTVPRLESVPTAMAISVIGNYIAWQALIENSKFSWILHSAIAIAATRGTSFRGADLTDADFTQATLKSTNFREANVTRTCWFQAKKLDLASVGTTYLEKAQVRQLVITKEGQDKNFDGLNLRGVNLQGANLADASFIGADLSEANLQDANLSRAKLKQTQLDGTDLTGACLKGACIEDWGITDETKLHGVQCEYVFMRLPTKDDPNPRRKPDNWAETFKDGDFADFIAPLVKTLLDLYHNQQVNTDAAQLSFNQLAANHPEAELSVIAVEARGKNNDKLLIRAKVAQEANTSKLSAEYFYNYNRYKALPPEALRSLLAEKDKTILMLAGQVDTALKRPGIYAQTYQHTGDNMSEKSGINIEGSNNTLTGVAGGDFTGIVTNTIGQLEKAEAPEAPKLAGLLKHLQAEIEADSNLQQKEKQKALAQVKVLAEAGQNPKEEEKQSLADTALTMLKGIFAGLPAVATLVEAANKLLPAIAQLFAL